MSMDVEATKKESPPQFGLTAMLWTMGVMGLALAYLRRLESPTVFLGGAVVAAAAMLIGLAVGALTRRIGDASYWSLVITTAAYLSVAPETSFGPSFHFAWSLTGAMAGACCGAIAPRWWLLRMAAGAGAAGATMWLYSMMRQGGVSGMMFDVVCAPIIGALVGLLIELIQWLEREHYSPRYVTASWLLLAVIGGNLLVPLVLS